MNLDYIMLNKRNPTQNDPIRMKCQNWQIYNNKVEWLLRAGWAQELEDCWGVFGFFLGWWKCPQVAYNDSCTTLKYTKTPWTLKMSELYGMWLYLNQITLLKKKLNVSPSLSELWQTWIIGIQMNKSLYYNIDNISKLKGARLRKGSFNLGEAGNVYSRVLWIPHWLESAQTPLVPFGRTSACSCTLWHAFPGVLFSMWKLLALSGLMTLLYIPPLKANTMWEKHFQLEETNHDCHKERAASHIWPLF